MVNLIKRPLIWVFGAYLAGLLLAWYGISFPVVLFLIIIGCLCIYLFMFRIHNGFINRKDLFLWSLPFLLVLGYLAMRERSRPPELENAFDEEAYAALTGKISMVVKRQKGTALYVSDNVVTLSGRKEYLVENILINCSDSQNYYVGNKIYVSGKIRKFSQPSNPGQFNEWMYYKIQNIDYKVMADKIIVTDAHYSGFHYLLDKVKQRLLDSYIAILPQKEAGTIITMLLGEKYLLVDEIRQLYQENGISHILSISGLHISLIGISIYTLLRKLKAGLIPSTAVSIILIFSYGVLTNFSVSTNRAVVMFIVMLLAKVFGKTYDMLSGAALSAFIILLQNPLQVFDAGFLLSFGAVIGIAVILPTLRALFPVKGNLINGVFVSISAQAMTLPLVLYFYFQLPVYSILINLILLPGMTLLVIVPLIAGIAGIFSMKLGVFFIGGTNYILKFYEGVCRLFSSLPGNLLTVGRPDLIRILIYFILIFIFLWGVRKYRKKGLILLPVLALLLLVFPGGNAGFTFTMLDVGQGEALFMKSDSGTAYLIDGGSADINQVGTYRIQPFLLSDGVDCIDYAIVTHTDADHISGLTELLNESRIKIKNLVLPDIGRSSSFQPENEMMSGKKAEKDASQDMAAGEDSYAQLQALAFKKGVTISYIKAGDRIQDGKLQITCLHPYEGYQYKSENAYSSVLSITYGDFDMLLTGDLQADGEKLVMDRILAMKKDNKIQAALDYDILKVAHHGSKSSTMEEFLQLVRPEYSLISCGKDNYYGHPHKELLKRLENTGSRIIISYESGAVTIKTDGRRMELRRYKKE